MKVKISDYEPWWSLGNAIHLYARFTFKNIDKFYKHNLKEGEYDFEDSPYEVIKERLLDFSILGWRPFLNWQRRVYDWDRRVKVKIHKSDIWSMDSTLAHVVLPMLILLKETKQGAPAVDLEDVPEHLQAPLVEDGGDPDKFYFERWDWVMGEMIHAFTQINRDWMSDFETGVRDIKLYSTPLKDKDGNDTKYSELQVTEGPNHTLIVDTEGQNREAERIQNGFRLFGKYYQSLWN